MCAECERYWKQISGHLDAIGAVFVCLHGTVPPERVVGTITTPSTDQLGSNRLTRDLFGSERNELPCARRLALWLGRHRGHKLAHNVRGFRCMDEPDGQGDRTFLVDAAWNEADTSVDGDLQRQNSLLARTVTEQAEHIVVNNAKWREADHLRARAERAEKRRAELSIEVGDLKRENEHLRGDIAVNLRADVQQQLRTIDKLIAEVANADRTIATLGVNYAEEIALTKSLRANLAESNAREVNRIAEITDLKRLLCGHTCYPSPAENPTREEAIGALRAILARIDWFGMQVMPVGASETGLKQACDAMDAITKIARKVLP